MCVTQCMSPIEIKKINGNNGNDNLTVKIFYDECPENPLEWNEIFTIVCAHSRYNLGNKQLDTCYNSFEEAFLNHIFQEEYEGSEDKFYDEDNDEITDKFWDWIESNIIWLPVYMYDHSGVVLNTTGFSCPWDSGQVGYIYITKKKVNEIYGNGKTEEEIKEYMRSTIETYSKYLNGEVYYYTIENDNGEFIDSCGGFYSIDDAINYAIKEGDY